MTGSTAPSSRPAMAARQRRWLQLSVNHRNRPSAEIANPYGYGRSRSRTFGASKPGPQMMIRPALFFCIRSRHQSAGALSVLPSLAKIVPSGAAATLGEAVQRPVLDLIEPGLAAARVDGGKAVAGDADEQSSVRVDSQPARGSVELGNDRARRVTGAGEAEDLPSRRNKE